ncbi:hypothetical protein, partial [Sporosarcina sp. E16_8]|uniref:hypothetical protein n=1 Tax=Sporosarcina sp. E16_8 TaxID=2789295 RepID=UPI001A915641
KYASSCLQGCRYAVVATGRRALRLPTFLLMPVGAGRRLALFNRINNNKEEKFYGEESCSITR